MKSCGFRVLASHSSSTRASVASGASPAVRVKKKRSRRTAKSAATTSWTRRADNSCRRIIAWRRGRSAATLRSAALPRLIILITRLGERAARCWPAISPLGSRRGLLRATATATAGLMTLIACCPSANDSSPAAQRRCAALLMKKSGRARQSCRRASFVIGQAKLLRSTRSPFRSVAML